MPQDGIQLQVDTDEYAVEYPICCSVRTFVWTNFLWAFLSLGLLVLGVVGIVIETGVLVVLPPAAYFTAIGIGAFGVLVIFMGILGQRQSIELCFLLYILFVALGLIAQTLAYCYLLLYANDVSTIATLDNAAINAQDAFESNLVDYALNEPAKWLKTQDALKCCGIDFEIGIGKDQAEIDQFESGKKCENNVTKQRVEDLRQLAESQNFQGETFIPARDDDLIGAKEGYFCKDKISQFMKENTPIIGAVLGLIWLVQIIALVSAARMYWVPDYLGGWQIDEVDLEEVAKRKGLEMPKLPEENAGFAGNLKAATQRLSFRFKNAFTADPEIPKSEGFLNRLSFQRGTNVAFGQPDPKHAPPNLLNNQMPSMNSNSNIKGGPPPGMFQKISNRLSQRMSLNKFGGGMFSFPKQPSQPPPGMKKATESFSSNQAGPPGMSTSSNLTGLNFNSTNTLGQNQSMNQLPKKQPMNPPPGFNLNSNQNGTNTQLATPNHMNMSDFNSFSTSQTKSQSSFKPPSFSPSRMSQRLKAGLQSFQSTGFGFKPNSSAKTMNGLPKPNAGLNSTNTMSMDTFNNQADSTSSFQSSSPPPNFKKNPPTTTNVPQGKKSTGGFAPPMGKKSVAAPKAKKSTVATKKPNAGGGGLGGGLLAQIQMGTQLKHAQTNDRSAPKINM